jgi:hypothetical protein
MADYIIEARSFRLGFACHNFWVLADPESDSTLGELHGLATSRVTGRTVPIGTTSEHSLRVYVFPHVEDYARAIGVPVRFTRMFERSHAQPVYQGTDARERWAAAVAAVPQLNLLDLDYPPFGVRFFGLTVNSNSAYRTFGEIMGVPVHDFPRVVGPGLANRMIALEEIERLRFQADQAIV